MKTSFPATHVRLALGILSLAAPAQAQLITSTANLPPVGGVYLDAGIHQTYGGPALEFLLSLPQHKVIADEQKNKNGTDQQERFQSSLDANLEIVVGGGSLGVTPIQATGLTDTVVHNRYDAGGTEILTGTFQTEMLALNLTGISPLGPFMIRESPTLPSLGQTTITDIGGGLFRIDSFFDVFTELSIDGGATWMPSVNQANGAPMSGHMVLQPIPEASSLGFLVAGTVGVIGYLRSRR